jgi:hypothetical protein
LKIIHVAVKDRNPALGELMLNPRRVSAISILRSTRFWSYVDLSTLDTLNGNAPNKKPIDASLGPLGRHGLCLKRTPVDHVVDIDGGVDLGQIKKFFLNFGDLMIFQVRRRNLKVRQDRDNGFTFFLVKDQERSWGSAAPEARERAVRKVSHVLGGHARQDTVPESKQAEPTEMNSDHAKDVVRHGLSFFVG